MAEHSFGKKFLALLATGRVANLPTVWSNVVMAYFLAISLPTSHLGIPDLRQFLLEEGPHFDYWLIFFACIATSLLYVGGCMLGDCRDIHFDRKHRPGRPLVTGLLSTTSVAITAWTFLALGLAIGSLSTGSALIIALNIPLDRLTTLDSLIPYAQLSLLVILTTAIILYAFFHKKSRLTALLNMGLCRALLVLFSFSLAFPILLSVRNSPYHFPWLSAPLLIIASSVGIYTLLLASVAATESNKNKIEFSILLKTSMFFLPILAVAALVIKDNTLLPVFNNLPETAETYSSNTLRWYFIGTLVAYCGWMIHSFSSLPHDKPAFVSRALAGFCLLDACFAATYSVTVSFVCIILFGLALLLQKITPAT